MMTKTCRCFNWRTGTLFPLMPRFCWAHTRPLQLLQHTAAWTHTATETWGYICTVTEYVISKSNTSHNAEMWQDVLHSIENILPALLLWQHVWVPATARKSCGSEINMTLHILLCLFWITKPKSCIELYHEVSMLFQWLSGFLDVVSLQRSIPWMNGTKETLTAPAYL